LTGRPLTKSYQVLPTKKGGKRTADSGEKALYPTKTAPGFVHVAPKTQVSHPSVRQGKRGDPEFPPRGRPDSERVRPFLAPTPEQSSENNVDANSSTGYTSAVTRAVVCPVSRGTRRGRIVVTSRGRRRIGGINGGVVTVRRVPVGTIPISSVIVVTLLLIWFLVAPMSPTVVVPAVMPSSAR